MEEEITSEGSAGDGAASVLESLHFVGTWVGVAIYDDTLVAAPAQRTGIGHQCHADFYDGPDCQRPVSWLISSYMASNTIVSGSNVSPVSKALNPGPIWNNRGRKSFGDISPVI